MQASRFIFGMLWFAVLPVIAGQPEWKAAEKTITRLDLEKFDLPTDVKNRLKAMNCRVPQPFSAGKPANIIRGRFSEHTVNDWAGLCSENGVSSIFVIWERGSPCPNKIASSKDSAYLQTVDSDKIGYSRQLLVASPAHLRKYRSRRTVGKERQTDIPHDGIEDAYLQKASSVHVCLSGKWIEIPGSDYICQICGVGYPLHKRARYEEASHFTSAWMFEYHGHC